MDNPKIDLTKNVILIDYILLHGKFTELQCVY